MLNRGVSLACCLALMAMESAAEEELAAAAGYGMTAGRIGASTAALLGLIGAVIGGLALARTQSGKGHLGGIVALVFGLIGAVISGLVLASADGGVGTGNGVAGGVVALVASSVSMSLGGLAWFRSPRAR